MNNNYPREIHCVRCGRFLGYELIEAGGVMLGPCPKCKGWTVVKAEGDLTEGDLSAILEERVQGQRGRR